MIIRVALQGGGHTTATGYRTERPVDAVLVLAHGAGAGQQHPFMVAVAGGIAARGIDVVTFNFPYTEQRRRTPDSTPTLEECFRRAIAATRGDAALRSSRLFIGGKSMGGRIATHLAAHPEPDLQGVIVLGYPLHPPGKPEQLRIAHLPSIAVPVLIVQGERDAFGTPAELTPVVDTMRAPVTLHVVPGGDHSLAVRGQPRERIYEPVLDVIAGWIRGG